MQYSCMHPIYLNCASMEQWVQFELFVISEEGEQDYLGHEQGGKGEILHRLPPNIRENLLNNRFVSCFVSFMPAKETYMFQVSISFSTLFSIFHLLVFVPPSHNFQRLIFSLGLLYFNVFHLPYFLSINFTNISFDRLFFYWPSLNIILLLF